MATIPFTTETATKWTITVARVSASCFVSSSSGGRHDIDELDSQATVVAGIGRACLALHGPVRKRTAARRQAPPAGGARG